jgi:hypothetical protein
MPDFNRLRRAVLKHAAVVNNLQKEIDFVARAVEAATVNCETVVTFTTAVSPACTQLITDEFGLTFSADGKTLYMGAPVSVATARTTKRARARSPSPARVQVSSPRNVTSVNYRSEVPREREKSPRGEISLDDFVNKRMQYDEVGSAGKDAEKADDDDDDDDEDGDIDNDFPVLKEDVAEEKAPLDEASALVVRKMALNDAKIDSVTEQLDNATDSQKPFLTAELERLQDEQKALQRSLANSLPKVELADDPPNPDERVEGKREVVREVLVLDKAKRIELEQKRSLTSPVNNEKRRPSNKSKKNK